MTIAQASTSRRSLVFGLPALVALTGGLTSAPTGALGAEPVYTGRLSDLALGGYDPVAYVLEGRPVEGSRSFSHQWMGATWRFASQANLDAFRASPARYAPQFGGHCAWAAAKGYLAPGDPRHWRIVEGKLYVNYDARVQADWERDIPGHIRAADANWPGLLAR